jgi:hypothetical protein
VEEVNRTHHWHGNHRLNKTTVWVERTKDERITELRDIIENGFTAQTPRMCRHWDSSSQKWRNISEPAQWPDQYVHHALVQVLQPVMMRGMDSYCCGSIRGRGTSFAKASIQRWVSQDIPGTKYEFTGDIYHFYDSLQPEVVMNRMRHLIKDRRVLDIICEVTKGGILIGSYTSQWFANTVLQPMDQMIRQSGLCSHYERYMDNLTIFGSNKRKLRRLKKMVGQWLKDHGLELKGDWQIFRVAGSCPRKKLASPRNGYTRPRRRLPDAVGYRYGREFCIPRKKNLLALKRAIAKYRRLRKAGKKVSFHLAASLLSRIGQLKHCSNYHLYRLLFRGERLVREWKRIVRRGGRRDLVRWEMCCAG